MLSAQGLLVATKGARGGTYVTRPSLDLPSRLLEANISLLAELDDITLDELLEAREADRGSGSAPRRPSPQRGRHRIARGIDSGRCEQCRGRASGSPPTRGSTRRCSRPLGTHCSRPLRSPLFTVLQTSLARSKLGVAFARRIDADHREITHAIARADEAGAGEAMEAHLAYLQPHYRRVWRLARERRPRA